MTARVRLGHGGEALGGCLGKALKASQGASGACAVNKLTARVRLGHGGEGLEYGVALKLGALPAWPGEQQVLHDRQQAPVCPGRQGSRAGENRARMLVRASHVRRQLCQRLLDIDARQGDHQPCCIPNRKMRFTRDTCDRQKTLLLLHIPAQQRRAPRQRCAALGPRASALRRPPLSAGAPTAKPPPPRPPASPASRRCRQHNAH